MRKFSGLLSCVWIAVLHDVSCALAQTQTQISSPDYAAGLGTVPLALKGQGGVSICVQQTRGPIDQAVFPLIIPSGTIFSDRQSANSEGQAFITTQTVTLTPDQPCDVADASSVVSHTRNWLTEQVVPQAETVFLPVGEASGNGVDTHFEEENTVFRRTIAAGAVTARVMDHLHDTIYLTESDADIEDPDAPGHHF